MEMYPPMDGTPSPSQSGLSKFPQKSDADCFASYSDMVDKGTYECYRCSTPARGANFTEFFEHPAGRPSGVVRFSCGCDGAESFGISPSAVFPQWRIISEVAPGIFKVAKRSRQEREELASGETAR